MFGVGIFERSRVVRVHVAVAEIIGEDDDDVWLRREECWA